MDIILPTSLMPCKRNNSHSLFMYVVPATIQFGVKGGLFVNTQRQIEGLFFLSRSLMIKGNGLSFLFLASSPPVPQAISSLKILQSWSARTLIIAYIKIPLLVKLFLQRRQKFALRVVALCKYYIILYNHVLYYTERSRDPLAPSRPSQRGKSYLIVRDNELYCKRLTTQSSPSPQTRSNEIRNTLVLISSRTNGNFAFL